MQCFILQYDTVTKGPCSEYIWHVLKYSHKKLINNQIPVTFCD